jgi:type IV pilus assembly protein PilW
MRPERRMGRAAALGIRSAGFSLVELMIAMVLGLLVMGAAFAVFMSNQNTYRANEGLNRIQEATRTAFELMSRDIRAAGASACSNLAIMETTGGNSVSLDRTPVFGDGSEMTAVSGSELAFAAEGVPSNQSINKVTIAAGELDAASDVFNVGDSLVLCDAHKTFVTTATAISGREVTFTPAARFHYPVTVMLGRYRSARWFVASNDRGGSSLYVSRAAGAREEVVEGVTSIAFSYLQSDGTAYTAAPADWASVAAVRTVLTLQAQNAVDGQPLTRTASSVVNLRARAL